MDIKDMNMEDIEKRTLELESMLKDEGADLDTIDAELLKLEERKALLISEREERKKMVEDVMNSKTVDEFKEEKGKKIMEINELRNSKEYINAYAELIKGNEQPMREMEKRTDYPLLSENATGGTVAVPELVYDVVRTAWDREGIMSRVRKAYLKGNLKVGFEISGDNAIVHTEGGAAINGENLVLGVVNIIPQSIKKAVQITDEVYDMRGEDFLRYIYDELAYKIAKKAADTLLAKIEACGTLSTTTCPGVPKVDKAIAQDTIATAIGYLSDEADNPVIIMNKLSYSAFKAAQYNGNYATDIFENLTVVFNNSLTAYSAATTGVTYAIVGDLDKGALANFPNGEEISFKFDDLTYKKQDLIEVMGREYVGLGVVNQNHFVKICKPAAA